MTSPSSDVNQLVPSSSGASTHGDEGFIDESDSFDLRSPSSAPATDDEKRMSPNDDDDGIEASGSECALPPNVNVGVVTIGARALNGSAQVCCYSFCRSKMYDPVASEINCGYSCFSGFGE